MTAAVILTVIQKVFTGPVPEHWADFPDLDGEERLSMAPVIGLMMLDWVDASTDCEHG